MRVVAHRRREERRGGDRGLCRVEGRVREINSLSLECCPVRLLYSVVLRFDGCWHRLLLVLGGKPWWEVNRVFVVSIGGARSLVRGVWLWHMHCDHISGANLLLIIIIVNCLLIFD